MGTEIIASIVTSSVALLAAILSGIISFKTLKLQKKLSNSPLQIEYLNRKLMILENIKNDLINIDHKFYADGSISEKQLNEIADESTSDMLTFLSKSIEKLKGYFFDARLTNVDLKVQKIKRYISFLHAEQLVKDVKPKEDFSDLENNKLIYIVFPLKEDFKALIINEISSCTFKIENIIKINAT